MMAEFLHFKGNDMCEQLEFPFDNLDNGNRLYKVPSHLERIEYINCNERSLGGYIYSKKVMREALIKYQPIIDEGRAMGCYGACNQCDSIIYSQVSHILESITETELGYECVVRIFEYGMGKALSDMLKNEKLRFLPVGYADHDKSNLSNFHIVSFNYLPNFLVKST
jgi:hypothetical protein